MMESVRTITNGKIIMEDFLMLMTPLEKKKQIYVSAAAGSDDRRLKKDLCGNFNGRHRIVELPVLWKRRFMECVDIV